MLHFPWVISSFVIEPDHGGAAPSPFTHEGTVKVAGLGRGGVRVHIHTCGTMHLATLQATMGWMLRIKIHRDIVWHPPSLGLVTTDPSIALSSKYTVEHRLSFSQLPRFLLDSANNLSVQLGEVQHGDPT